MSLLRSFQAIVRERNLFNTGDRLLLAVSGGLDSVVLLDLCHTSGYSLVLAHCNFGLRGEESERDEKFVGALAERYGVRLQRKKFDTRDYASHNRLSIQEAARQLRYEFFDELLKQDNSLRYLLTAHHADDNVETLLMNFFRGTGLHGLTGIPSINGAVRRPLLSFTRKELEEYAQERALQWVEDSSNDDIHYTRNFFRHELIPALTNVYPKVKENLRENIRRFSATEQLLKLGIEQLKKKIWRQEGVDVYLSVGELQRLNNQALLFELVNQFGFTEKQLPDISQLLLAATGKWVASPDHRFRVIRHRRWLVISPQADPGSELQIIIADTGELNFPGGKLLVSRHNARGLSLPTDPCFAVLNAARISFPLILRRWKPGDYFYPLGMRKKKKLSRLFIDQKLSLAEKQRIWILESDQRIAWVIGQRIDDRFRVEPDTTEAIRLEWISGQTE